MERALILSGGGARGAFQAGVLKYLDEIGWKPDLICGSSVGAVNAAAVGCGISNSKLRELWMTCDNRRMYKATVHRFLQAALYRKKFSPLLDTGPMRDLLMKYMNIDALRNSDIEILISAVNMKTSELTYFNQRTITIDHIMASGAMPILFPWQYIEGKPYWDGGVMANIPIMPALEYGAKTIVVVFLSPVGNFRQAEPKNLSQALELVLEHFLIGQYSSLMASPSWMRFFNYRAETESKSLKGSKTSDFRTILTVSPSQMLGLKSLIYFSPKQTEKLIDAGYHEAKKQLKQLRTGSN